MRLYGEKFARKFVDRRVNSRKETADAILWSVDWENNVAIVRIQGSSEDITAHFPRNWKQRPYWLKPRNAVRIIFREGRRGYVEISGEGRAIPTPVDGPIMPEISGAEDQVISGCEIVPTSPESLDIVITSGYYSIDGTIYYLDPTLIGGDVITLGVSPVMVLGSGTLMSMGSSSYTATLDAAPACGLYRYDAFVVGVDGVIDYLKGTTHGVPVKPTLTADHVLIDDYILVCPNVTAIYESDIGAEWAAPVMSNVIVTSSATFAWSGSTSTPSMSISLAIKDQYECAISVPAGSVTVTVAIAFGTGQVGDGSTWSSSYTFTMAASGSFYYQRNQATTEHSPFFTINASLAGGLTVDTTHTVTLLDNLGAPIY